MTANSAHDDRIKDIKFILKDLLKVIKVVSMYPVDNPLPQSMKRSFAEKLVGLVEQYGQIAISVEKDAMLMGNDVVFQDRSKEESLAGIFFGAGITDLTFRDSLDVDEVYKLLEAIKDHVNSPRGSQDLASRIWELALNGFTVTTLEDIALSEYGRNFNVQEYIEKHSSGRNVKAQFGTDELEGYQEIFGPVDEAEKADLDSHSEDDSDSGGMILGKQSKRAMFYAINGKTSPANVLDSRGADNIALRTREAAEAMGFDDLPSGGPTLVDAALILNEEFKLSEEEEASTFQLVSEDAKFDTFESTTAILKEMLHQETDMDGFYETVTICEKVTTEFLNEGRLTDASHLLQFLMEVEDKIRDNRPLWAERLRDAYITAGSRERLKVLVSALNNHPDVGAIELQQYLNNFGWESLSGITELLADLDHRLHREALCDYLATKGRDHPDIVAKGIYHKLWYVARNSASILARIGNDRSLSYLRQAAKHKERRVRMEVVTALKECPNSKALEILGASAMDTDQEIRRGAIAAIVARRGRAAFETIAAIINDEHFNSLERSDQTELLRAFSILGGDASVSFLSQLILQYNPLRNQTRAFYRRAAFDALSHNRSEKGKKLLVKLASSWRPDIRRQATAALRRHREITYGEKQ